MAIKRIYGKEQTIGDILYNTKTKTVFFSIDGGVFGKKNINLVQNAEETYDMFGTYFKDGKPEMYKMGKTFPVKDKQSNVVEGITSGSIGLSRQWDKDLKKEIVTTNNAIFFTTHKLKESIKINDSIIKVGWVTGQYGIEVENDETSQPTEDKHEKTDTPQETPTTETPVEDEDDNVPF